MSFSWRAGTLSVSEPRSGQSLAGQNRRHFPTIILNDDATARVADDGLQALLARISEASSQPNPCRAIEAVLKEQTVDPALAQAEIYISGQRIISDTIAVAAGNAKLDATGSGMLLAVGNARVRAADNFQVWLTDDVTLYAYDNVRIDASGRAKVHSYDESNGVARDQVQGTANQSSNWKIKGEQCFFTLRDRSLANATAGTLRCFGRSRTYAEGTANVSLFESANGWLDGEVQAELHGESIGYAAPSVRIARVGGHARKLPLTDPFASPRRAVLVG